jgi:hypothetical protein
MKHQLSGFFEGKPEDLWVGSQSELKQFANKSKAIKNSKE